MKCTLSLPFNELRSFPVQRKCLLFVVPNVTSDPSTASVPIIVLLCNGPLLRVIAQSAAFTKRLVPTAHHDTCRTWISCRHGLGSIPTCVEWSVSILIVCMLIFTGDWGGSMSAKRCLDFRHRSPLTFSCRNGAWWQNNKTFHLERLWFIFLSNHTFCPPYT